MKRFFLAFALSTIFLIPSAFSQKLIAAIDIGGQALAPVANLATNMIYVPNSGLNTLTVISGESETVVANIPMPYQPQAAAINTATNMVYVATDSENYEGAIAVVDASSNTVVATVPAYPVFSLAVNPVTNLVYFDSGGGIISVLDASINQIVAAINTGLGSCCIQGIDINTVTNRIYATDNFFGSSGPQLVAIDGATNRFQVFPLTGTYGVTGPSVDSSLNRVYIPVNSIRGLLVVNGNTGKVVETVLQQCNNPATVSPKTHLIVDTYFDYQRLTLALGFFNPRSFTQVGVGVDVPPYESPNAVAAGANNRYYVNFFDNVKVHTSVAVISGP